MIINIIKSSIIMLILDIIFIMLMLTTFKSMIFDIQGSNISFKPIPAIICYVALIFGLNYFILNTNKTNKEKIIDSILLGLVIYTVYETTNYTIIDKWRPLVAITDSVWGGILFGLTTAITLYT